MVERPPEIFQHCCISPKKETECSTLCVFMAFFFFMCWASHETTYIYYCINLALKFVYALDLISLTTLTY
jgi:hypothetical protein